MKWRTLPEPEKAHILTLTSIQELVALRGSHDAHVRREEWTYGTTFPDYATTRDALQCGRFHPASLGPARAVKDALSAALYATISRRGLSPRRAVRYNPMGGEVEAERWLAGNPNYYAESRRGRKSKFLTLGINGWLSHGNNEAAFRGLAGAALGITEALRSAGYGVRVDVVSYVKSHNGYHSVIRLPLLRSVDRLNYGAILRIGTNGFSRDFLARMELINIGGDPRVASGEWDGECLEIPPRLLALEQIDIYITKSWTDEGQADIIQSVVQKLSTLI